MKISPDKKAILLVVVAVAAILAVLFVSPPTTFSIPLSKEEAVEISKSCGLVREGLEIACRLELGTHYYNSSVVEQLKERWLEIYGGIPEGHGVWQVIWVIYYDNDASSSYSVNVVIDAETGVIADARKGPLAA